MIQSLYTIFNHWSKNGTVWIYSDPYFGDNNLIHYPFDNEQIKSINSKVGKNDTLIILGDIGNIECVRSLRGYKVLVCGNHDLEASNYKAKKVKQYFDKSKYTKKEALKFMYSKYPNWKLSCAEGYSFHFPFEYYKITADNGLFDEVYTGPLMISDKIILSHEPIDVPWAFNIHGHVHDLKIKNKKNQLNVCADCINYTPINLNQLIKKGIASEIITIHRDTIDKATERKYNKK